MYVFTENRTRDHNNVLYEKRFQSVYYRMFSQNIQIHFYNKFFHFLFKNIHDLYIIYYK